MTLSRLGAAGAALFVYAALSRLAYVLWVGYALRREDRTGFYSRRLGVEAGFQRFRRFASIVMNHDALAFGLLCVGTRGTLVLPVSRALTITAGFLLATLGFGAKLWAARTLGSRAYYWYNFFSPDESRGPARAGPYRFVSNPMYTLGYLQTYGIALILGSWPGLIASAFAQVSILLFYRIVEKPHFERLHGPN